MILHENSANFPLLAERREPAGGTVPGAMELELHQLDLRYAALRRRGNAAEYFVIPEGRDDDEEPEDEG
jgi:hypothetical protein